MKRFTISMEVLLLAATCLIAQNLEIQYHVAQNGTVWDTYNDAWVQPYIKIKNNGTSAVSLNSINVEYYIYTSYQVTDLFSAVYYSSLCNVSAVQVTISNFNPPYTAGTLKANRMITISFNSTAQIPASGTEEVQVAVRQTNYNANDDSNDWSWINTQTFVTNNHIVIANASTGTVLFGTRPPSSTQYTLTITQPPNGTITANPAGPQYYPNTVVTLTQTPNAHYHFDHWTGGGTLDGSTNTSPTITMTDNYTVSCVFAKDKHTVTVTINDPTGQGTLACYNMDDPNPNAVPVANGDVLTYDYGTHLKFVSAPPQGCITKWTGDLTVNGNEATMTLNASKVITVTFKHVYQLTISKTGTGNVKVSINGGTTYNLYTQALQIEEGTRVMILAEALQDYTFLYWLGIAHGKLTDNPATIEEMNHEYDVQAFFDKDYLYPKYCDAGNRMKVDENMWGKADLILGKNANERFIIHPRSNANGDFLIFAPEDLGQPDGWDWNKSFTLLRTGRVGIGTVAPSSELEVKGKTTTENMIVSGNLGVGITTTPTEKIEVDGAVKATAFKIGDWVIQTPDYVFGKKYILKPLQEIELFIKQNKHLPDVPSAEDMKKNGVDLSELNMTLLKKIEELTLYTIEQNKKMIKQQESIEKQQREIMKLKRKIEYKNK